MWAYAADCVWRIDNFDPGVGILKQDLMNSSEILNEFGAISLSTKALQAQQRVRPYPDHEPLSISSILNRSLAKNLKITLAAKVGVWPGGHKINDVGEIFDLFGL